MEKKTAKPRNAFIERLVSRMTLDQKVGAMMTLTFSGVIPSHLAAEYITKYHCSGLRLTPIARASAKYIDPRKGEDKTQKSFSRLRYGTAPAPSPSDYRATLKVFQDLAKARPLGIPLHFSFDQEGGIASNIYFGNIYPQPMGIRASDDPHMAYLVARANAEQGRAIGFSWIHSPEVDINTDPLNPEINHRAYSDDPEEVAEYAVEAGRGFKDGRMIATAKHFPGRGDSALDAHYELATIDVDRETMMNRELLPYRRMIEADVLPAIMIAHTIYPAFDPDNIATVSKPIITGLLREELGFEGVITTDSMSMGGVKKRYGVANACAMALEAGADIVLLKTQDHLVEDTFNTIRRYITEGRIPMEEVDKKVYRILNMKYEYGLFHDYDLYDLDVDKYVTSNRFTQIAWEAAKRSVLIARDLDKTMPLSPEERVLVVEQVPFSYNNMYVHPGMLYEACTKYSSNVDYLETEFAWDELDVERLNETVDKYDKIVITNFYYRASIPCTEPLTKLIEKYPEKTFIVVTDTPYTELSIPENAKNVILSFSPCSPEGTKVVAGVLYGKVNPEGVWPVKNHTK